MVIDAEKCNGEGIVNHSGIVPDVDSVIHPCFQGQGLLRLPQQS